MENYKFNWASSIQPTIFKIGEYNPLLIILTLRFINCVKFNFGKSYLSSDSYTNIATRAGSEDGRLFSQANTNSVNF